MASFNEKFRQLIEEEYGEDRVLEGLFVILTFDGEKERIHFGGAKPAPREARVAMLNEAMKGIQ